MIVWVPTYVPAAGEMDGAIAVSRTVKFVVAVVLVSVMTSVPAADPTVRVAVALVLVVTVGVPILDPVPPLTENSPAGVSESHSVLVPVRVTEGVRFTMELVGETLNVARATVIVVLIESVVSVMVSVPVPEACSRYLQVSEVAEELV